MDGEEAQFLWNCLDLYVWNEWLTVEITTFLILGSEGRWLTEFKHLL